MRRPDEKPPVAMNWRIPVERDQPIAEYVPCLFEADRSDVGHRPKVGQRLQGTGRPIQREPILTELHQRIRDVRQGPDGLLYLLTDENPGVVLKIEPVR